jgi:hypothetical protein
VHLQTRWITASKCISELHDLQTCLITTSKCISKFNLISASKCISELHDLGLQMHLQTHSITASNYSSEFNSIAASKCISDLLDLGLQMHLQMHLQTHSIFSSKCISQFNLISASKCFSKPARSRPPRGSMSSAQSWSASVSPNSLDRGLQVHLPVHTITASKCISMFSQSSVSRSSCTVCSQIGRMYIYRVT